MDRMGHRSMRAALIYPHANRGSSKVIAAGIDRQPGEATQERDVKRADDDDSGGALTEQRSSHRTGCRACFTIRVDIGHQEGVMRKIVGAIAMATLVGTGLTGLPAAGAAAGGRVGTADFTGIVTISPSADCVEGPRQDIDATITGKKAATLHIEGCVDLSDLSNIRFTGSFTITWPQRHSVMGTVTNTPAHAPTPCASGTPVPIDLELTPVRAHGQPRPPIAFEGNWCAPGTPVPGPISGTVTGALPPIIH